MKIHHIDGTVLWEGSAEMMREELEAAVAAGASLDRASLVGARLDGARLDGARLSAPAYAPPCPASHEPSDTCACRECDDVVDARDGEGGERVCECCSETQCLCIVREVDGELGCSTCRCRV